MASEICSRSPRYAAPVSMAAFQVTPKSRRVDRRVRPEGRGDLAAERVLGLAEIARIQDGRPRHALDGEVGRHRPVRRVESLDSGARERDRRMVPAAEQVGVHEPAHEAIVGHVDAGHRDRHVDRRGGGPGRIELERALERAKARAGTSRSPCSRARTRRSSTPDRWSMSQAWSPWRSPPAVRCGATPQSGFGPTTSQR